MGTLPLQSVMVGAVNTTMKCDDVGRQEQAATTQSDTFHNVSEMGREGGGEKPSKYKY